MSGHTPTGPVKPLLVFAPDEEADGEAAPGSRAGDHRVTLVRALTDGAAAAFASGDARAAMVALDALRVLVGDAADGAAAPVVDLSAARRKRGDR